MSSPLVDQVRSLAADVFAVPVAQLKDSSAPPDVETWDSVNHLNLILAVEQEFGVQLGLDDMERLKTIGDIARVVEEKRAG